MNKKLLTVAVAAAVAAPVAALADVTIYGHLHMSVDYVSPDQGNAADDNLSVSSNSSRIGFKGTEDLGSGLKAVWQIESQVKLDESNVGGNSTAWADRNSFLGVAGNFGTAIVGRHDTPFKILSRSLDPFVDTIADTRQVLGQAAGTYELRPNNVIAYITPSFSGVSAVIAYVAGFNNGVAAGTESGMDNNNMSAWSMNATYTNGPIYAGLAYEKHSLKNDATSPVTVIDDTDGFRIGGSYAFGAAKLGAMYEVIKDIPIGGTKDDRSAYTLFGTYDFGLNTAKLAYTQADDYGNVKNGGSLVAVGLDHNFTKRTKAYVQYTSLDNNREGTMQLGGGGGYGDAVTASQGNNPTAFSVGMIHKF